MFSCTRSDGTGIVRFATSSLVRRGVGVARHHVDGLRQSKTTAEYGGQVEAIYFHGLANGFIVQISVKPGVEYSLHCSFLSWLQGLLPIVNKAMNTINIASNKDFILPLLSFVVIDQQLRLEPSFRRL